MNHISLLAAEPVSPKRAMRDSFMLREIPAIAMDCFERARSPQEFENWKTTLSDSFLFILDSFSYGNECAKRAQCSSGENDNSGVNNKSRTADGMQNSCSWQLKMLWRRQLFIHIVRSVVPAVGRQLSRGAKESEDSDLRPNGVSHQSVVTVPTVFTQACGLQLR